MRDVTIKKKVTLYKFSELSVDVQKELIDTQIHCAESDWNDRYSTDLLAESIDLLDESMSYINKNGFVVSSIEDVYFSYSASQGDGFSFVGDIDISFFLSDFYDSFPIYKKYQELFTKYIDEMDGSVFRESFREYSVDSRLSLEIDENLGDSEEMSSLISEFNADNNMFCALYDFIDEKRVSICLEVYNKLVEDYLEITSVESAKRILDEGEKDYLENGEEFLDVYSKDDVM